MIRYIGLLCFLFPSSAFAADTLRFERIVIDDNFPGGYQVEVADVNGDKKPDIVALGGSTIAWYENPTWEKRIIATGKVVHDIISSATTDIDGDGRAEVAIAYDFAMNVPARGKLLLARQGTTADSPWTYSEIADVPSIHRVRWGDLDGDGKVELIVAPIFGAKAKPPAFDQDPARLVAFYPGEKSTWTSRELARRYIMHSIEVTTRSAMGSSQSRLSVYTADRDGVAQVSLTDGKINVLNLIGTEGSSLKQVKPKGSSEIHVGMNRTQPFLATIDPWHGNEVVIYHHMISTVGSGYSPLNREVLDNTLDTGHALWVADVDGDGIDEVFAGHRGKGARVACYHNGKRIVLDDKLTGQDLRGGDIDGDGTPDIVAIGGQSHNVVWFKPIGAKSR